MKIEFRKLFMLCCCALMWIQSAQAQLTNWQYASVIEITEQQGLTFNNEQVLVTLNTAALIANGQMQASGADMRFATDCDGTNLMAYSIESGINTTATKVWLRVPQVSANATTTVYFFSGNALAAPGTDFSGTFPNTLIITSPTITNLVGTLDYDWFEVEAGATVNLLAGQLLSLTSNKIKIDGVINGAGLGESVGLGVGNSAATANDGSGGGGYGGVGGDGGFAVVSYVGGGTYGNQTDSSVFMGSGGGVGISVAGGNGGGGLSLIGLDVEITGTINMDGADGNADLVNEQGTGGGSGGTILVEGRFVNVSGSVSAMGGNGGTDALPTFGGGGGGAGGRIKTFYSNTITFSGTTDVTGGTGGCCGTTPSTAGGAGTTHQQQNPDIYSINVNPFILRQSPVISGAATTCENAFETYSAAVIPGNTYLWSAFGGTVTSGQGSNTVEINWTTAGDDTVYLITGNLFLGCFDTITYPVFVSDDLPAADFTFSIACTASPVNFSNISTIGSGAIVSYAWDFGDGNTSSTLSPQHTYGIAATYNASLIVTSDNGCTDTISKSVVVEDFLDAGFTAATECKGDTTFFVPNSLAGFSYAWNFGDGNTSITTSPTHVYAAAGTYAVTVEITSTGGCVSTETGSATVNAIPVVDFEFVSACPNADVAFMNLSSVASGSLTYAWNFGDAGLSAATNPVHPYTGEGTYTVKLIATSTAACVDSISKSVEVYAQPVADFSASIGCQSVATQFANASGIASGFLNYTWDFGDGSLLSNALNPTHVYNADGNYNVTLVVLSNNGCADTTLGIAVIYQQPSASFTANTVCFGDTTFFNNTSTAGAGISYFWDFDDGNFSGDSSPAYVYGTAGSFNVTLDVTTADGCVAQAQQTVTVFAAPSASFTAPDVCAGVATQFTNSSFISSGSLNFIWDFGDGNGSSLDNPLHTYATAGSYIVTLIATSGSNCADTTSLTVDVLQQPNADFQISTGCFGSDVLIYDLSTGVDVGAYYQVDLFNDGIYDNGPYAAGDTASITVGFTGNQPVRIRLTNFSGCVDSVVEVMTVNAFPTADFIATDACFGNVVSFTNMTTSTDPNLLGSLGYSWSFGDGSTSTDINPTHLYDASAIYTVTLIAVSSEGCSDTFSNTLIVYPLPVPDFTHAPACDDQDVIFTNTSTIPFGTMTHHWDFGDNATAVTLSPTHAFSSIGIYDVTLTDTSDAGCINSITKSVIVNPNPTAAFVATEVCEGTATEFTNLSSVASGALTYEWDFGDSFNSVDEDPTHTYADGGDYDVVLEVRSDAGCTDTKSRTVSVFTKPDVSFTSNTVCDGGTVNFTNNTTVPGGNALFNVWNFGDGTNSFDDNPSHLYASYGTYSVKLFVQSEEGCSDSLLQAVIVFRHPNVLITHNGPLAFCDGGDVTLAALAFPITNTYTYSWSTGETDSSIVITTSGTFCVTVTDQNGCVDDTCEAVTVWTLPVVTATADVNSISKGYFAQLVATGGVTYQWSADPPDATLVPNAQSPTVSPVVTTTYTVTATDANGCTGTATVTITVVDDYFVHATNVITPNGDAYNQNWFVENILSYPDNEVLIFDRWGTLVYQKSGYDNTWEGTHNDKDLPQGTYYYVIKFENLDKVYKGSVSIVR
ncbi:MAG: DUF2341 domain-containing protein [Chitinophagales bacterium]|nr:DUF2341 domain-containing protein [Chitinophagales bacterium]